MKNRPANMGGNEGFVGRLPSSWSFTATRIPRPQIQPNRFLSQHRKKALCLPALSDTSSSEMSQAPCTKPPDRLSTDCLCSQGSLDRLSVDDFWQEVQYIQQSGSDSEQEGSVGDAKQPEEGEQEKEWLQDAGLSTLISEDSEDVDNVGLLSTLTRTQAAAVQRRLDTYTCSVRKKNKQPVRDVRDIFRADNPKKTLMETKDSGRDSQTRSPLDNCGREFFITDVAYSDQAAILQKQTKLQSRNSRRRKDDGTLPKLISAQCRLGVTRIGDLSAQDMKKVRQLALIDMTALCDILEVELKRHKLGKRKLHESCLFGVPLATLVENDQKIKPTTTVPLILQAMFSFLEKKGLDSVGILRVPGSQSRIKNLQQKLETNFYPGLFSWEEVNPNDVAALLKKFIRELPAPLLTPEHLHTFNTVQDIQDLQQRLHVLNLLVLRLPEPNRSTLKALLEYLEKVVSRENKNRMSLWNVSTIMAPNLFMHKGVPPSKPAEGDEKEQAERAADVMSLLIQYQDLLWTIPNFLMVQVRKLNENSSRRYQFYDRRIKNLLRKVQSEKTEKNPPEPYRTVKIQAAHLLSDSMEVRLDTESRAVDALAQFHMNLRSMGNSVVTCNGSTAYSDYAIYEVGGNIGEHCLDPNTHLLDLYNNNPSGEWIIKLRPASDRLL
ncbi:rho GTPase-activating protein 40-like isoform X1 [Acipenser oxyrinchus oxyrinchus]|uniref:Rho GTPase-activating protein 40-like isoform X1 n=1 Tax=Acipenser oxyrinchus oxyrinchus TaxID=40147 RepID=A0AAD8CRE8_ACIOX|nr:rho GTPase-activating protein 40-like isoform X1 [Acipenser oxyrinchus oxyrinchus]